LGALGSVLRLGGSGGSSMPQDTLRALQDELGTWEILAQVCVCVCVWLCVCVCVCVWVGAGVCVCMIACPGSVAWTIPLLLLPMMQPAAAGAAYVAYVEKHAMCHTPSHQALLVELLEVKAHHAAALRSRTPLGHARNAMGYGMSAYCLYRMAASAQALLLGEDMSSDPVSRCRQHMSKPPLQSFLLHCISLTFNLL
jgi:hypothetical protein